MTDVDVNFALVVQSEGETEKKLKCRWMKGWMIEFIISAKGA